MSKELDKDYKVPEGFEPHLIYPDGVNGIPCVGFAILKQADETQLLFNIEEKVPALPLLESGKFWYMGWDIPTPYAIDANKQCWMGGGHGEALVPVTAERIIEESGADTDNDRLCKLLGVEPPMAEWQKKALAAGWTPPEKRTNEMSATTTTEGKIQFVRRSITTKRDMAPSFRREAEEAMKKKSATAAAMAVAALFSAAKLEAEADGQENALKVLFG